MPSNHLILCRSLLLLPSIFPSIGVFSNESALHIRWPSIGVSASTSVLPMNTQDWSPLGWTGWISLQSRGLSRVFANKGPSSQGYGFSSRIMYGCENWTIKKAEHRRTDAFELWCWRRLLRVPWTARISNQSILEEIGAGCSLERLMLKLKLQYLATWCEELTHWKRPWCWEWLRAGGEWDDRGWDGWMASPTQWTYGGGLQVLVMDWEDWCAVLHGVTKNWTWLSDWTEKETKELYTDNYKTLMKEIKDDIKRWRDIPCFLSGRVNVVKMTTLPNAIYR